MEGEPLGPGRDFVLGTDTLGRDEFSRLLYGARVSLAVGIGANLLGALIGIAVGGIAGMAGASRADAAHAHRRHRALLPDPAARDRAARCHGAEPTDHPVIIGVAFGAYLPRIVFTQVVTLREREFVLAARTAGVSSGWILIRHIVPHVIPSIIVFATLGVATAIQLEAALSYVGIGIQPPEASWGNMIAEGRAT